MLMKMKMKVEMMNVEIQVLMVQTDDELEYETDNPIEPLFHDIHGQIFFREGVMLPTDSKSIHDLFKGDIFHWEHINGTHYSMSRNPAIQCIVWLAL